MLSDKTKAMLLNNDETSDELNNHINRLIEQQKSESTFLQELDEFLGQLSGVEIIQVLKRLLGLQQTFTLAGLPIFRDQPKLWDLYNIVVSKSYQHDRAISCFLKNLPDYLPMLVKILNDRFKDFQLIKSVAQNREDKINEDQTLRLQAHDDYKRLPESTKLSIYFHQQGLFQDPTLFKLNLDPENPLHWEAIDSLIHNGPKVNQLYTEFFGIVNQLICSNIKFFTQYFLSGLFDRECSERATFILTFQSVPDINEMCSYIQANKVTPEQEYNFLLYCGCRHTPSMGDNGAVSLPEEIKQILQRFINDNRNPFFVGLQVNDLLPFEQLVFSVLVRLGLAKDNESSTNFCNRLKRAEPGSFFEADSEKHVLARYLDNLLVKPGKEQMMLTLLMQCDRLFYQKLRDIYAWSELESALLKTAKDDLFEYLISFSKTNPADRAEAYERLVGREETSAYIRKLEEENERLLKEIKRLKEGTNSADSAPSFFAKQ